jgi:hypothetical protein
VRLLVGLALIAACAPRTQPYRFASPMLGMADVPPAPLGHETEPARNVVTARPLHIASAAAADAVAPHGIVWSRLPAPNLIPADTPLPDVHHLADLRALVGRRTKVNAIEQTLAWSRALGGPTDLASASPIADIEPGDLLIFDDTEGAPSDLVAIAIGRDARGVTEFIYIAGTTVRRGFADPSRPSLRRDATGLVVNTFMRAGNRWPPKGTHYLSGELLSHVVHGR